MIREIHDPPYSTSQVVIAVSHSTSTGKFSTRESARRDFSETSEAFRSKGPHPP